jgi:protein gp37
MNPTKIDYLTHTHNVFVGCSGENCAVGLSRCWAKKQAKRKKPYVRAGKTFGCQKCYLFNPHIHSKRFLEPITVKKPCRVGLNFMSDTFDTAFNREDIAKLFLMVEEARQHTFLLKTKQPQNIQNDFWFFPRNLWLGVSVNCKADLWRIDKLLALRPAPVILYASIEPLYSSLGTIEELVARFNPYLGHKLNWIIIGGQTKPTLTPEITWVREIEVAAEKLGIPVFEKNNIGKLTLIRQLPKGVT